MPQGKEYTKWIVSVNTVANLEHGNYKYFGEYCCIRKQEDSEYHVLFCFLIPIIQLDGIFYRPNLQLKTEINFDNDK